MQIRTASLCWVIAGWLCAGCTVTPPTPGPAPATPAVEAPGAIHEVHFVEASGPPRSGPDFVDRGPQDPPRARPTGDRPETHAEDPEDPRIQLAATSKELEREQRRRLDAEQVVAKHAARIRDLEARVLSLTLERVMFEQEVLRLRIDAAKAELAALGAKPVDAAEVPADRMPSPANADR